MWRATRLPNAPKRAFGYQPSAFSAAAPDRVRREGSAESRRLNASNMQARGVEPPERRSSTGGVCLLHHACRTMPTGGVAPPPPGCDPGGLLLSYAGAIGVSESHGAYRDMNPTRRLRLPTRNASGGIRTRKAPVLSRRRLPVAPRKRESPRWDSHPHRPALEAGAYAVPPRGAMRAAGLEPAPRRLRAG